MENSNAQTILNKFSIISMIMQYFGMKHSFFLVLSRLWKNSRDKLNEWYSEFVKIDRNNILHLEISSDNIDKLLLLLPTDLFSFDIILNNREDGNKFIEFFEYLNERKGCYFNDHYMNERIFISTIFLSKVLVRMFDPYAEKMKSIDNLYEPLKNQYWRKSCTLFD